MFHKSYTLYFVIFNYIKTLLASYNIQVYFHDISFMLDFEKSSKKTLFDVFPKSRLMVIFHYDKALRNKARKLGLTKKKLLKDTIVLTFSFKLYQFMKDDDKTNFLNEIKKIYSK